MIHDIFICIKSLALIALVWCADMFIIQLASLSIIAPSIRETLIDFKEIISIAVSILIAILTVYKIRNERKK